MLIALHQGGKVVTAPLDANGDPIVASTQDFIQGLTVAEGAMIDPVSGEFLFSNFGGANEVIRVSGFDARQHRHPLRRLLQRQQLHLL
ncbi:MAG: hypothetical protein DME99_01145 [Verrucomicrobia bacterium]|nr:MAG: hypothetical protein DME99_01145 [Verrucomicrobiota bacterium]